jgi:hypothetical protein
VRRANAVVAELANQGVPSTAIDRAGEGENELLVPTGDGVREARNRRVTIAVSQPAAPEMVATPVVPETTAPANPPAWQGVVPAAVTEMTRGRFSLGALYGFNTHDDSGSVTSDDKTSHLAGLNLSFDYGITNWLSLSLEQAGFYHFLAEDNGWGGRTAAGLDFTLGNQTFIPHIGGNIGYLYGEGIEDDFFAGPEIGLALGPIEAKVAYDIPWNRDLDEGIVMATLGLGIRF